MTQHDLSGTVLDGRYKVIEPIAEGAMGAVYRGERLKLGRAVAIKVLHEELPDELSSRERFEREAKLMARLEHPHCVSVIDFGVHDDKPFLVMDLVRGTSLLQVLEQQRRFEIPRAAEILRQVLSGLGHAHELGIVHRDIKPANIMVSEKTGLGEQVRILDFGLARLTETSTKLTTGIVVGTPNYMAPEQCKGGDIDGRTDLYAVGVMLFEMLTGRKPFLAEDPIAVVRKHLNEPPPTLAEVVPGDYGDFEAIVARALAKAPADRYATAAEMSAALEAAAAKRGVRAVAELMGRAVPAGPSARSELATPSGWSVPVGLGEPASGAHSASLTISHAPIPDLADPAFTNASAPMVTGSQVIEVAPAPLVDTSSQLVPVQTAAVPRDGAIRPSSAPRLPFTRRQMMIGGGGVLGAILLIAIVASRGGAGEKPAADAGVAHRAAADAQGDPVAPLVARINDLLTADDKDAALDLALRARRQLPDSAALAYVTGRIYFWKLYWTDGIKNLRDAIRLDASYRSDPELIKTVLAGFATTPDVDDRIAEFIRDDLGAAARPYLEDTAKGHGNPRIRARAAAELRRLR